jgi:hypothetical protein
VGQQGTPSFGLDDFGLDDRMRLFGYVTAENRVAYLWILRAFDAARATYQVVLHTTEVSAALTDLFRKLNRLDRALADVAERAARFYHMLGDLGRTHDVRPTVFLAHKDALLGPARDADSLAQRLRLAQCADDRGRTRPLPHHPGRGGCPQPTISPARRVFPERRVGHR